MRDIEIKLKRLNKSIYSSMAFVSSTVCVYRIIWWRLTIDETRHPVRRSYDYIASLLAMS